LGSILPRARRIQTPRGNANVKLNVSTMLAIGLAAFGPAAAQAPATAPATPAGASKFVAGTHYQVITPAQPTSSDAGKIEVAEVFMFGCPGCFAFEPHLQAWLKTLPDYVSFVRIPAPWNPTANLHARAYYTAAELGKTRDIEGPLFDEFHVKHNPLDSEDKLAAFFKQFGVEEATFRKTFESFAVGAKSSRAEDLIKRYRVSSTPSVVVNGKYLTNGTMAGSYEAWFAIIDELVAQERAANKPVK
jgi:thiol:disulfide interchange protein DsbA